MLRVGLNAKELVEDLHQSTPSELLSVRLPRTFGPAAAPKSTVKFFSQI